MWTKEFECVVPGNTTFFAVSFKLLAVDYLLKTNISSWVDKEAGLPTNFWDIAMCDLSDFNSFVHKVTQKMMETLSKDIDSGKQHLFNALYASKGSITVKEISDQVHWSSRQINRYFKNRFGISLKAHGTILRYSASFGQLKGRQLYPEQPYADQAHFIKEVKKYSGVTPKQLAENKNDRRIH